MIKNGKKWAKLNPKMTKIKEKDPAEGVIEDSTTVILSCDNKITKLMIKFTKNSEKSPY